MRRLVLTAMALLLIASPAFAAPYLVCDPQAGVVDYQVDGAPWVSARVPAEADGSTSGPPYNGTGAEEGPSPVTVGNLTTKTLTGLTNGQAYFFTVTAHDTAGFESDYSNEVVSRGIAAPGNLRVSP